MLPTPTIENKDNQLNLGFIGLGWIGRNRMEVLLKNPKNIATAILEPANKNAEAALLKAPEAEVTEAPSQIYNHPEVDGVIIATPSAMHASQSIEALKAGKAVFCQKPLGRTAAEVAQVVITSEKADKLLGVDLSYRYTKAFQAIYTLINSGEIGDVYAASLVFHNAYGPDKDWFYNKALSGGGCVMDLGIHLIDLALWSLGFPKIKEVKSQLYHQGKKWKKDEETVEDHALVTLITENDIHIYIECSWNISAGKDAVIEAHFYGTEGGAAFKNTNGSFYDFTAEKYKGTHTDVLVSPPDDWSGKAATAWAEQVRKGQGYNKRTGEEFIQTAQIIDRIYEK